jgi:hypothetical protein
MMRPGTWLSAEDDCTIQVSVMIEEHRPPAQRRSAPAAGQEWERQSVS